MIKLGISQGGYHRYGSFENQVKKLVEHGYDCLDYQEFVDTDTNPLFTEMDFAQFSDYLKAEREILEKYGIEVVQTHAPWRFPPKDSTKQEQEIRLAQMCRAVEGTAILGAKYFVVHALMPCTINDRGNEKETAEVNVHFLTELCKTAERVGVIVCLENMPMLDFSIGSVQQVIDFVELIGAPNLKICLDTGHVTMFGLSPAEAVRMIGKEKLATLHVHDNNGKADQHLRPFEGVINWGDFCKALSEVGFDGVFSLECSISNVPDALTEAEMLNLHNRADYLRKLI